MTVQRCGWCSNDPLYIAYHDHEWGQPLHDEKQLFSMLCLEGQQAGLSWITVLKKREHYHRQFFQHSIEQIAALSDIDLADKVPEPLNGVNALFFQSLPCKRIVTNGGQLPDMAN